MGVLSDERKQAIAWLRSMGRNAKARDWAMGKTIVITIREPEMVRGIQAYPGAVYLYPAEAGGWNLLGLDLPDPAATMPTSSQQRTLSTTT